MEKKIETKKTDRKLREKEEKESLLEKASGKTKPKIEVSARKVKMLSDLVKLIKESSTVIISSLKGMPSAQFQKIRKKLKGKAVIKVIKKQIMARAMEEASKERGEEHLKEIEKYLEEGSAIIFSQLDVFELASILADERVSIKAKAGQMALHDIEIDAGSTDIPAGPMISDFGNAGIKIAIEGGKIVVKESKVLIRQQEKISDGVAGILGKLEILPFNVGLEPLAAFDAKTGRTYVGIKIDKHEMLEKFKKAYLDSKALAISINYPAAEIIGLLLSKAAMHAKAIDALIKTEQHQPQTAEQDKQEAQSQMLDNKNKI
jgi:large subunit ribosomal protein L10